MVWLSTPWGVRVYHDSLFYLSAAKNISQLRGAYWIGSGGELKALNHFPPFYSLSVAIFVWLGFSVTTAARMLGIILAGINTILLAFVLHRFTQSVTSIFIGVLTIFFVPTVFGPHLQAMSEPLFIMFMLIALSLGAEYLHSQQKKYLLAAAVVASLAGLTRWIGISVLLTLIIVTFFLRKGSLRFRLGSTLLSGLIGFLPILGWMLRNRSLTGSFTNRTFQVHLIDLNTIRTLLDVLFRWFTPIYLSHWVQGIVLIIFFLGGLLFLTWCRRRRGEDRRGILFAAYLFLTFPMFYLLQVLVSLSFFDASTRIDDRILSPVFVSMMMSIFFLFYSTNNLRIRLILITGFIALLAFGPLPSRWSETQEMISSMQLNGAGFTSKHWRSSEIINWIQKQEDDATIITNQAMVVNFLTGYPAIQVPERWDPVKDQIREDYQYEIDQMLAQLETPNAYLVLFERQDLSIPQDQAWTESLSILYDSPEGIIYYSSD
jgi:hypothetical protein